MTPFLEQIARHYIETAEDISRFLFVFPSHRAEVFFRKFLCKQVASSGSRPLVIPQLMTIDAFMGSFSSLQTADSLTLIVELYKCYSAICEARGQKCEPLDEFVFWGDVILNDFSDIDRYMLQAGDILRNVSQLKEMSDDLSYLSPRQQEAVDKFLGHFKTTGEYKQRFARLWNILGTLYNDFNASLLACGRAYPAMQQRMTAASFMENGAEDVFRSRFPHVQKVVFCGLNVLCECEKKVLGKLRDLGIAEFCWDYVSDYIRDPHNKSSLFMRENVSAFPQAFALEACPNPSKGGDGAAGFELVSVPSGIGQTKVVSEYLRREDVPSDERTAVILPDENLLQAMLNSIPARVEQVNVTMGCSMVMSSFYSMMDELSKLQLHLRCRDGAWSFYHRNFWNVTGNNLFAALLDDEAKATLEAIRKEHQFYIPEESIKGEFLSLVFRPVVKDIKSADRAQLDQIRRYQEDILYYIGRRIASDEALKESFALELDFCMEYVKALNLIGSVELDVLPQTYFALLDNLLRSKSIPLKGEPLSGLQIMGPLETRALDFDHVFILNCNEGVFPRGESKASFIPPLLRTAFALPNYEYQDAVWAYYFYRLIQRASKVTMIMDSRSEGLRSGEESRYVRQLEYHFKAPVQRILCSASPQRVEDSDIVEKTQEHIDKIKSRKLSASALQDYLLCSMKFYYSFVEELRAEDELSEDMDSGAVGTVYHNAMQALYENRPDNIVTREYLESLQKKDSPVERIVDECAMKELRTDTIAGRNIVLCAIICKYVRKTIMRDIELLERKRSGGFVIRGLEHKCVGELCSLKFKGRLDRIDSYLGDQSGTWRIVDYKTGKVLATDVDINDDNAQKIAKLIFSPDTKSSDLPKIALQFFIYDMLLGQDKDFKGNRIENSVYSTREIMSSSPSVTAMNPNFVTAMKEELAACLEQMLDPGIPFVRRTPEFEDKTCGYCNFKMICGR